MNTYKLKLEDYEGEDGRLLVDQREYGDDVLLADFAPPCYSPLTTPDDYRLVAKQVKQALDFVRMIARLQLNVPVPGEGAEDAQVIDTLILSAREIMEMKS